MICIHRNLLRSIGMTDEAIHDNHEAGHGLATSSLFSFGGGGNRGRDTAALEAEPAPRTLLLVGMADAYGEGARRGAAVEEICLTQDGRGYAAPTPAEAQRVADLLEGCAHPDAATIRAAFLAATRKIYGPTGIAGLPTVPTGPVGPTGIAGRATVPTGPVGPSGPKDPPTSTETTVADTNEIDPMGLIPRGHEDPAR
jgi:hypothetical protein